MNAFISFLILFGSLFGFGFHGMPADSGGGAVTPRQSSEAETASDIVKTGGGYISKTKKDKVYEGYAFSTTTGLDEGEGKIYQVKKIIDGDTIVVLRDGKEETVRLIGIDTPETSHPYKKQECFGAEATKKAREILEGKRVRMIRDESQANRGKYGRLLRYVYLPDGRLLNKIMIADGYAYEYTYNIPSRYQGIFKKAQRTAQEMNRGLWAPDACVDETNNTTSSSSSKPLSDTEVKHQECSFNAYDCSDFDTQSSAQKTFEYCGGPEEDPHYLDADGDGDVCESMREDR